MLATSVFMMLFFVLLQNKRRGWKTVLLEMIPVVVGLKPAVDAFRVVSGAKIAEGQTFDPLTEMTIIRVVEMFAEAIPGAIIQLSAILSFGISSHTAIISLISSALTTGFVSSCLSYDWDTDPRQRAESAEFYGYIPNRARYRAVVFVVMILFSSIMLLVRASVLALLGHVEASAAVLYVLTEMALYLLFKIARKDFYYWLPLEGLIEIFVSLLNRVMVKILVDFTSNAIFRHPNEVGGIYWLLGFVVSIASLPLAIIYHESKVGDKVITEIAWNACIALTLSAISVFALFFATINKEYRRTFYSTERGKDFAMRRFLNNSDDAAKADAIFYNNRRFWIEIEDKVEKWVRKNWNIWMEEEPEWLDDNLKSLIPLTMIPNVEDKKNVGIMQDRRRRGSMLVAQRRDSMIGMSSRGPSRRNSMEDIEDTEREAQVDKRRRRSTLILPPIRKSSFKGRSDKVSPEQDKLCTPVDN